MVPVMSSNEVTRAELQEMADTMTIDEIAERFQVSKQTVYRLFKRADIQYEKPTGGRPPKVSVVE